MLPDPLTTDPPPPTHLFYLLNITFSRHRGVGTHHALKWGRVEEKERKRKKKINPFMPFKFSARPHTGLPPRKASYNYDISSRSWVHPPGLRPMQSPSQTHRHSLLSLSILLACLISKHFFFLKIPSRYQFISSATYPLNVYQHFPL